MTTSLEQQDMNEWWNEMDDNDNNEKGNSVSQSSMSLSHTLPSTQALQLANYSTASSDVQSKPKYSNLTPTPQPHHNNNTNNHENENENQIENEMKETPITHNPNDIQISTINNGQNGSRQNIDNESKSNSDSKSNDSPNPSSPTTSSLNITYDDKNFTKFNKIYKYKKCNKNTNSNSSVNVYRITSHKSLDLCFKETVLGSNDDLKRCVNELKSLKRFYGSYYNESGVNTEDMVSLYVNKKKGSTSYPKKARIVMKYHDGEDLDDFLVDEEDGEVGFLYEDDFRAIMKKILYQLSVLHSEGILHCDLKPNNIRYCE